jgi:hypothetical protein
MLSFTKAEIQIKWLNDLRQKINPLVYPIANKHIGIVATAVVSVGAEDEPFTVG